MCPRSASKPQGRWLRIYSLIGILILSLAFTASARQTLFTKTAPIFKIAEYRHASVADDCPRESKWVGRFTQPCFAYDRDANSNLYATSGLNCLAGIIDTRANCGVTAKPSPKVAAELARALKSSTGSHGDDESQNATPLDNILDALRKGVKSLQALKRLLPKDWTGIPTRKDNGLRYADPARRGDQIRFMRGNPNDPNPVKQGPYVRISKGGQKFGPFPLEGNPTLQ